MIQLNLNLMEAKMNIDYTSIHNLTNYLTPALTSDKLEVDLILILMTAIVLARLGASNFQKSDLDNV